MTLNATVIFFHFVRSPFGRDSTVDHVGNTNHLMNISMLVGPFWPIKFF
jgi:hypothetical protein